MGWSHVQHVIDVTASFQVICSAQLGTRQGLAQDNGQLAWQQLLQMLEWTMLEHHS